MNPAAHPVMPAVSKREFRMGGENARLRIAGMTGGPILDRFIGPTGTNRSESEDEPMRRYQGPQLSSNVKS